MKQFAVIALTLFCLYTSFAQNDNIQVSSKEIKVGTNLITNQDIMANQVTFPCYIYYSYLDTLDQRLTLQLRYLKRKVRSHSKKLITDPSSAKYEKQFMNQGFLAVYDLKNYNILWSKETKSFDIAQSYDILIKTDGKKSTRINTESGNPEWQINEKIVYFEPYMNIALGNKNNILNCYNLTDGSLMWYRKLEHKYGWGDIFPINDSALAIPSSGFQTVNVKDGTGFDYHTSTKHSNAGLVITADVLLLSADIPEAGLPFFYLYYTSSFGHARKINDIRSNTLYDGTNFYFASKKSIVCINNKGQELWENKLPKKSASKSALTVYGNNVYLVNYGYAFDKHQPTEYGIPFIAAYDTQTGKQQFITKISAGNTISDFQYINGTLQIMYNNYIDVYSLTDGSLISTRAILQSATEFPGFIFIDNSIYIKLPNSTFECLVLSDTTKSYVSTLKGQILSLNNKLNFVKQIDTSQTYFNYLTTKDYRFLAKQNETIIINNQGKAVAAFKASDNSILLGSKLYVPQGENLYEIDLKDFIKN